MRFGITTIDITPPFPTAMHGYGGRLDTWDTVNDPLTFTAVVLEEGDRRAVIGAADLCTFANDGTTEDLLRRVGEIVGCPVGQVMLNASHTHGGPKMPSSTMILENERYLDKTRQYRDWLHERVCEAAEAAADSLIEGTLWYGEGRTTLPMNRRADHDGHVANAPNPEGPTDDRLSALVFRNAEGEIAAVGLRVSCHPVATGARHRLTADYPGAWRAAFKQAFGPDVTPFFLQGAGADARPRHVKDGDRWRLLPHAELPSLGGDLMAEMLQVLTGNGLRPIDGLVLAGSIATVEVPCEEKYTTREDFEALLESESGYTKCYAEEGLRRCAEGRTLDDHVVYQVQTLWLSSDCCLIGLNGEPLCGLGKVVEAAAAPATALLLGYVNGCLSYIADTHELRRGGYEANSYIYDLWTGPHKPGLEHLLAGGVKRLGP